ncbi:MAG: thioredoxin domain-containing protein [Candidatus Falkowbacteria bacterium]|nr:thioredoxin domain-containing protein [Candidatus Falkowbacteria bacterium]
MVVSKTLVSPKIKTYNRFFITFSLLGVILVSVLFILIKVNLYYDNLQLELNKQIAQDQLAFINKLPSSATAAADPTVIGNFNSGEKQPFYTAEDSYLGNRRALIRIFYFADYNSEASRKQEKDLKKIVSNFGEQVFLVRKDFPSNNQVSLETAKAARCAQNQGYFWQYHDLLLAYLNKEDQAVSDVIYDSKAPSKGNQLRESRTFMADLANRLGLNLEKFDQCLLEPSQVISGNVTEGGNLGISAVPTVYVNGQAFTNYLSYEDLSRLIKVVVSK